ncbi:MAG TPA: AI-2E family transporter [Oligoflexia bacterium]|nr:AI-2E family transporter [Oligoflexia bacterium]HMP27943.1 AI-2E family transporter [Oligoflexia bacterium]
MNQQNSYKESLLPPLWVIVVVAISLLIWLSFKLRELIVLVVVSYYLAYIINPLVDLLENRGLKRSLAALSIISFALLLVLILALSALPLLSDQFAALTSNFEIYAHAASLKAKEYLARFKLSERIRGFAEAELPAIGEAALVTLSNGLARVLTSGYSATMFIANLLLLPFVVFYLSADWRLWHGSVIQLVPYERRLVVKKAFAEIDQYVSAYIRGQLLVGTILFILYACFYAFLKLNFWFILAAISGYGVLVPYIGPLIGLILAITMSLATYGDLNNVLYVLLVVVGLQSFDAAILTPKIVGSQVGLSPLTIILSLLAGGLLFGLLGVILAVPGAAITKVLSRNFYGWLLDRGYRVS